MDAREIVSALLGWTYTLAWAASFAPQIVLSHRRRSVTGLRSVRAPCWPDPGSPDFIALNVVGFLCYSAYNVALFSSATIRAQFATAHDGHLPSVRPNDIAFALWALLSASTMGVQALVYEVRGHTPTSLMRQRDSTQRLSRWARDLLVVFAAGVGTAAYLATRDRTPWLEVVSLLGAVKLVVTCVCTRLNALNAQPR